MFTTANDGQTSVNIKVFQGEHELASYNKFLANFQLTSIARSRRGQPQIEVVFDIDVNGIVHVEAIEQESGQRQQIQISDTTGLSPEEIDRLTTAMRQ